MESAKLHGGAEGYPLRPESVESIFYLHKATGDPVWLSMGIDVLVSLQTINKAQCGYAATKNVASRVLDDRMDSYFLAETLKYLYLLFDEDHWMRHEPYVFNTEGHPLPVRFEFLNFSDPEYGRQAGAPCGVPGTPTCDRPNVRGACRKQDFRRTISAYGFDLMLDDDGEDELVAAAGSKQAAEKSAESKKRASGTDAAAESRVLTCPVNHYCPGGSAGKIACPSGRESAEGSGSVSDCACKVGFVALNRNDDSECVPIETIAVDSEEERAALHKKSEDERAAQRASGGGGGGAQWDEIDVEVQRQVLSDATANPHMNIKEEIEKRTAEARGIVSMEGGRTNKNRGGAGTSDHNHCAETKAQVGGRRSVLPLPSLLRHLIVAYCSE